MRTWCEVCGAMRDIDEVFEEGALEARGRFSHQERTWVVAQLSCGHQASRPTDKTYVTGVDG